MQKAIHVTVWEYSLKIEAVYEISPGRPITLSGPLSKRGSSIEKEVCSCVMRLLKSIDAKGAWLGGKLPNHHYAFICINEDSDLIVGGYS